MIAYTLKGERFEGYSAVGNRLACRPPFFALFKSVAFFIRKYGWNEFSVKQTFRLIFFGRNSETDVTVL